jgi:hypothetical protein
VFVDTDEYPQPISELLLIAKSKWHFDGVVLSMDGLIDEFGHTERHFTRGVKQFVKDLDALGLSKSYKNNKFQLRLDVDYRDKLTRDLPVTFKQFAAKLICSEVNILSHNLYAECIDSVPYERGLSIHVDGCHRLNEFLFDIEPTKFYVLHYRHNLRWTLNADGSVFCGSRDFENFYTLLLRK